MQIKAEEISEIIKQQVEGYEKKIELSETGVVVSTGDGIARVYGLEKAMAGELLEFPAEVRGIVLNLEEDNVGAVLTGIIGTETSGASIRVVGVPVAEAFQISYPSK